MTTINGIAPSIQRVLNANIQQVGIEGRPLRVAYGCTADSWSAIDLKKINSARNKAEHQEIIDLLRIENPDSTIKDKTILRNSRKSKK